MAREDRRGLSGLWSEVQTIAAHKSAYIQQTRDGIASGKPSLFATVIQATLTSFPRKLVNENQLTKHLCGSNDAVWTANVGTNLVRYFHELALSMCLGYAIIWTELATEAPSAPFSRLMDFVKRQFSPYETNNPAAAFPASLLIASLLAASFFVLFRLVSINRRSATILRWLGGVVALLAMPVTWFYVPYADGRLRFYNAASVISLLVITAVAAVCAGRYLCGLWSVPAWGSAALLVVYYGFWTWALTSEIYSFGSVRSTLAILSGIGWVLYVRRSERAFGAVAARS